ncbi:MAG: TolC family protein [Phycisphaerales bacterium]|nr:TolC family protein [Phycisphaerales bacterium]MCB9836230.1 TolC family protein [Phycisphaera sp.]
MAVRPAQLAAWTVVSGFLVGCSSPFDAPRDRETLRVQPMQQNSPQPIASRYRDEERADEPLDAPELNDGASPDDYVRYALSHSPAVEAAFQRWVASTERLPQVGSLPDPRLNVGFFLDEVETRTGPQHARIGLSQAFPWPGLLDEREDAAALAARAAWLRFEAERLAVTEEVVRTLHELAYLDAVVVITQDNLELLQSFEEVVRTRYRVGLGSHPELTRVQVELGQLEDRLTQLRTMRPAYVAELNAVLNRPTETVVPALSKLPGRVVTMQGPELAEVARTTNPALLALDEQIKEQRVRGNVARLSGNPELSVGLDYIVTGEAMNSSIPESGDDPILLSFGMTLPISREKYDAGVRESIARRLEYSHTRAAEANRITSAIQRAWFDHTDADRRVRLYEQTLIPKAEESLRASLAGFRAGDTNFLDLLDTERTLLEFAIATERARADRGQALAKLNRLVGQAITTESTDQLPEGDTP